MVDLLDRDESAPEVVRAKKAISSHAQIRNIFKSRNRSGYWGTAEDIHTWWPRKETTFWLLPVLVDFGFTVEDRRIAKACDYVLSTQLESGGFGWDPPSKPGDCHSAIIIESLAKAGLGRDPRVQKAYSWLVRRQRRDGGFWCKDTAQIGGPREGEASCAFATMFVMGAIAHHPRLRRSRIAREGVEFLLGCWQNQGKIKYAGHDSQIKTGWEKLKYPFTDYRILKFLDVLSQFDFARKSLQESGMIDILLAKGDSSGRFTPESVHEAWSSFDFGQKDKPSRWLTVLVWRIIKRIRAPKVCPVSP